MGGSIAGPYSGETAWESRPIEPAIGRPKAMRICIVLGPFLPAPPGPAGAVERRWNGVAPHLAALGHEVTIVCRSLEGPAEAYPTDGAVKYLPVEGELRTGRIMGDLFRDLRYSRRAMRCLPEADVVICNAFWLPVLLARFRRRRFSILTYNLARFPKGRWHLWLYRRVDRILAVSSAIREAVAIQFPRLLSRTVVVPNPIDTDAFRYIRPPGAADGGLPIVLYTGRVHPEKGIHLLVDACGRLRSRGVNVRLRIIGESDVALGGGGSEYVSRLRAAANDLPMDILPAIYNREWLAEALRDCDVYCYPSVADKGESFGVAPLEAMAVGCPVVVSGLECFNDFLEPGVTGLVFNHRSGDIVSALADRLFQVLAAQPAALAMGRQAARSAENFGYQAIAQRYAAIFNQALQDSRNELV